MRVLSGLSLQAKLRVGGWIAEGFIFKDQTEDSSHWVISD